MGDVSSRAVLRSLRWVWTPRAWRDTSPVRAMVAVLVQLVLVAGFAGRRANDLVPLVWCLAMPILAALTAAIERSASRQLEFTALLPLPRTTTKWIVLVPLSLLAGALVGPLVAWGRLPLADAVPLLGLSWWAIAVGHAFAWQRLRSRIFLMPLACWLAVGALAILGEHAGDGPASTLAGILGVLALIVVPARPRPSLAAGPGRPSSYPPRAAGLIHPLPRPRHAGMLSTSFRIWAMTTPWWIRYFLVPFLLATSIFGGLSSAPAMSGMGISIAAVLSGLLVRARAPATLAFLETRPFSRRSLWVGTWLPPIVLVVIPPLFTLLTIQEAWFIGPAAPGFTARPGSKLSYLRDVLGATFLPASIPAGGMPAADWPALRPLLVRHALRLILLSLALLFSFAGQGLATVRRGDGRALWPGWLSSLLVAAMVSPCLDVTGLWAPPLWLAGAMALMSARLAFRQDRLT